MIKVSRVAADRYVIVLTADDKRIFDNLLPTVATTHEEIMKITIVRGLLELSRDSLGNRS